MKRILALTLALLMIFAFASCSTVEKNITVVVREQGSGRSAHHKAKPTLRTKCTDSSRKGTHR